MRLLQVHLGQQDPQFKHPVQLLDSRVDVVWVQVVVFQGQEEDTGLGPNHVVWDYLIEFPRDVRDALQDRISSLLRMDQDAIVLVDPPDRLSGQPLGGRWDRWLTGRFLWLGG